jgi:hypothetical protein
MKELAEWAAKRAGNMDRLAKEAEGDDSALFGQATSLLDAQSQFLMSMGDEVGSMYVARLARQLENKHRSVNGRAKNKVRSGRSKKGRAP